MNHLTWPLTPSILNFTIFPKFIQISLFTSWPLPDSYEPPHTTTQILNYKIYKINKIYKTYSNLAFHMLTVTRPLPEAYEPPHTTTEILNYKIDKIYKISPNLAFPRIPESDQWSSHRSSNSTDSMDLSEFCWSDPWNAPIKNNLNHI
jgi:hypothetical protein